MGQSFSHLPRLEIINKLLDIYRNDFVYDIDYNSPANNDQIDQFMFTDKLGHFSSAMMLALRAAGVPSS